MERPDNVNLILIGTPERLTDRAKRYAGDIQVLNSYIRLLEKELREKEERGDAQKNYEALQKIRTILFDTLGYPIVTG
jgi:hypothetical protein